MVGGGTKLVSLVVVVVCGEVCGVLDITLRLYPGTGGGNSGVGWYSLAMEPCLCKATLYTATGLGFV